MPLEIRRATGADLTRLTELYNHYVRESPSTFDTEPSSRTPAAGSVLAAER